METKKKLLRLAAVGFFAAVIFAAAAPAHAWTSVGFSGTFVAPHVAVGFSNYPYYHYPYRYHRYYRYYRPYPVYYHHYYRPYVRYYYPPVRRVYVRPVYYGPYYYGY